MEQLYWAVMEIIESIVWVGLGFVPTLVILELASKRSGEIVGVHATRLRTEVKA